MFIGATPTWVSDGTYILGFLIALSTLTGIIIRFALIPHLKNIITQETKELRDCVETISNIVHRELTPNGGGSIKDHIITLKQDVAVLKDRNEREKD